jgi:hypothetical protein
MANYMPIAPIDGCAGYMDGNTQMSRMYGCSDDDTPMPETRDYDGAGCAEDADVGNATAMGDMYSCVTSGSACTFETATTYTDDGETCDETYAQAWTVLNYCTNTTTTFGGASSTQNVCFSSLYGSGLEGTSTVYFSTDGCTDAPTAPTTPYPTFAPVPTPAPVPTMATTAQPTSLDCTEYAVCDGSDSANTLFLGLVPVVLMALALFN